MMDKNIETSLGSLLTELSSVQTELLALLDEKRQLLLSKNLEELSKLVPREQELLARLQTCHDTRTALLAQESNTALPSDSIRSLAKAAPEETSQEWKQQIDEAATRGRLLQHKSLSNWVFVQRSLIHLSQMLEILATGGRLKPTYGTDTTSTNNGSLVDQAA